VKKRHLSLLLFQKKKLSLRLGTKIEIYLHVELFYCHYFTVKLSKEITVFIEGIMEGN